MVYFMKMYVDGACRGNGRPGAKGAAAAVQKMKWRRRRHHSKLLPNHPRPTNQRAELTALIMALELARTRYRELSTYPILKLKISSDSKYAVKCMTEWQFKWRRTGWINSAGQELVNRDLIERACALEDELERVANADIDYIWIPRWQNTIADTCCKHALDVDD
jgi:ribonuclease HI